MTRRFGLFALMSSLLLWGCPGDDDPQVLVIATPDADGITLTVVDDQDTASDGLQYTYIVRGQGLEGVQVTLLPESGTTGVTVAPASQTFGSDGEVSFAVNFSADGEFTLTATANELTASRTVNVQTACATTNFVNPGGMGTVNLGESDDLNGDCDDGFAIDVQVSTDAGAGASAMLLVNDAPAGTANIEGTLLNFSEVALGNRDTPNTLSVVVTRGDGVVCPAVDFPGNVFVDCAGPGCSLRAPDLSAGTLADADDSSAEPGFQATFEVDTDAEAAGAVQQLVVDGVPVSATATAAGMGAEAIFGNIDLSEGPHSVRPICADLAGNMTPGTLSEFTVDTTPCAVVISAPAADSLFIDEDDLDAATPGIQIDVTGTISGDDCAGVELAVGAGAGDAATVTGSDFSGRITLPNTSGNYDVTATVSDDVGNTSPASVAVRVAADGSPLQISSPSVPTSYNIDGSGSRTPDLNTDTPACDAQVVVDCGTVGSTVSLVRQDTDAVLGTADCEASGAVAAPFTGQATFASVALPSDNAGGDYNIVAQVTVDRIETTSAPLAVTPDCQAPAITIAVPMCDSTLRPATDDSDPGSPGFQADVRALNSAAPAQAATLRILNGASEVSTMPDVDPIGVGYFFSNANFGSGGDLNIEVCSTDGAGNQGCNEACAIRVVDLPSVGITAPTAASVVTEDGSGCGAGEVRFTGTTDAADAATAEIIVGGATTSASISGGAISACVALPEGAANAELRVTDGRGVGSASVSFTVDRVRPADIIDDLAMTVVDRRAGTIRFNWSAIIDDSGALLSRYELRCATSAITSNVQWDAATVIPQAVSPGADGTAESVTLGTFGIGRTHHCALRGVDAGGRLSRLAASNPSVSIDFQRMTRSVLAGADTIVAVGDVNGDGDDDFIVGDAGTAGASGNGAQLWMGATSISITTSTNIGNAGAAIGDINGDGINDFALADPYASGFGGQVNIFFGHNAATPWMNNPAPDLTLVSTTPFGGFGIGIAGVGDIDGGGRGDFAVAEFGGQTVYVVRGEWMAANSGANVQDAEGFRIAGMVPNFGGRPEGNTLAGLGGAAGDGGVHLVAGGVDGGNSAIYTISLPAWTSGLVNATAVQLDTEPGATLATEWVAALGDVNGDGRRDFATDAGLSTNGVVRIYRSSMDGSFDAANAFEIVNNAGDTVGDLFGSTGAIGYHPSLGTLGDVDGNSRAELLTGSSEFGTAAGGAELFFDPLASSQRTRGLRFAISAATTGTSNRVAYVGDVDGDGFRDIAFTDPTANEVIILH